MIWNNIEGVWNFLIIVTNTAPLSVWQFVIATIIPTALFRFLQRAPCRREWNQRWGKESVEFTLETIALIVGIALAWLPWRTTAGLLIGICAGLLSPYLSRGVCTALALWNAWITKRIKG